MGDEGDMSDPLETEVTRVFDAWSKIAARLRASEASALHAAGAGQAVPSPPAARAQRSSAHAREPRGASSGETIKPTPVQSPLFRHEAMRAYRQGQSVSAPLDVAPLPTRVLFFTLL